MDSAALRGLAVVSLQQAEKLGTIDDVLVDPAQHRLGGLVLHGGLFRGGPSVAWSAVRAVGQDAVIVDDSSAVGDSGPDGEEGLIRLAALCGTKVVTDSGDLIGTISGATVDPDSGQVSQYVVTGVQGGLFHPAARFAVPPAAIHAVGSNLMTVEARAVAPWRETEVPGRTADAPSG